jgi:hypothetical protein
VTDANSSLLIQTFGFESLQRNGYLIKYFLEARTYVEMKFVIKFFIFLVLFFLLVGCFGQNKPKEKEIASLGIEFLLNNPWLLKHKKMKFISTDIKIIENTGNKIEPKWGSRFVITVETTVPLYTEVPKENIDGIVFIKEAIKKNQRIKYHGIVFSTLVSENTWKHSYKPNEDGNSNIFTIQLKSPRDRWSKSIIIGSEEEKKYYAEIKRKDDEKKANWKTPGRVLVGGSWDVKWQYSTGMMLSGRYKYIKQNIEFKKDGTYIRKNIDGKKQLSWEAKDGKLSIYWDGKKKSPTEYTFNILDVDKIQFSESKKTSKRWALTGTRTKKLLGKP